MKHLEKYKFTKLKLTESEKIWLNEVYTYDFKIIDEKVTRVKLADKLQKGFDHKKIDYRLLFDNRLTLAGIWYVDDKNKYFDLIPQIVLLIKEMSNNPGFNFIVDVQNLIGRLIATENEISIALMLMNDLRFFSGGSHLRHSGMDHVKIDSGNGGLDKLIYFENIYDIIEESFIKYPPLKTSKIPPSIDDEEMSLWSNIYQDYSITKKEFGKRINFIKDGHTRRIIIRDVEQVYSLMKKDYYKPAIILSGSVIEEILRQLLRFNNIESKSERFEDYINACRNNDLLTVPLRDISNSLRHFRNFVHVVREVENREKITKSMASAVVSSIFVLADGLKHDQE